MRCGRVSEIAAEAERIISEEEIFYPEEGVEFYFRGESRNHESDSDEDFGTRCPCCLYHDQKWVDNENTMYEEAMRFNVADFRQDISMVERLARMQHFQLPTRFLDVSSNVLLSTHFACGGGTHKRESLKNRRDGFVRIFKVASHKMKAFNSDTIQAIAHLPLLTKDEVETDKPNGLGKLVYEMKKSQGCFYAESEYAEIGARLREDIQKVWAFKPLWNTDRIKNQAGAFFAYGCGDHKQIIEPSFSRDDYSDHNSASYGIVQIGYIRIAEERKDAIYDELRYFGVAAESVYPDLSSVCQEIQERFKTKGE